MITGEITVLDLAAGANPRALMAGFGRPTASQYASRYGSRVADEDIAPGGYYYPSRDPLASHVSPGHSANRQRVNPHAGDGEFAVSVPNPRQQPTPARRNPSQGRDPAPPTSCKHSFDPDTPVLMADGSTKPIKDVDVGDDVMAAEPETGRTEAKDVVAVHNNNDTDLTDLTISTADGEAVTTIRTTQHHPFWDETLKRWVLAADLQEGHQLLDNDMSFVTVRAVNSYSGHMAMRDLTVADIHTYYVAAGDHAVLVHNCNEEFFSVQDASDAARLRSGGEPWPTEPHRTAWGEGVYAFDNSASANRYMEQLLARRPDLALEVVRFSVPKVSLGRMRSLDLDSLPQTEIDAFMDQHYIASLPSTHGYEYLTRGTQYGQEHFFDNLCTAR